MKTAFILAAGKGTRMLPLTKNTPKPLLRINNKLMIDYVIGLLEFHKFEQIGVNVSYRKSQIEKYLRSRAITLVAETNLTGTAGGVMAISEKLKPTSPFLIISADMMVNFDLSKIYRFHVKRKAMVTICCYFRPKSKLVPGKSGLVVFDRKTKEVLEFDERPASGKIISQWVNSSVYVFDPQVLNFIPQGFFDISKDLIPLLLKLKKPIFAYPVNRKKYYQLGIDTPQRLKQSEEDLKSGKLRFNLLVDFSINSS